ncbi:MAG TPA: hypothetical protein VGQ81_07575 [Acidobacteriota bacterium]|jgi:hypothetical protein|nr:hypothetical protein [Acidobacteriota bacterium]
MRLARTTLFLIGLAMVAIGLVKLFGTLSEGAAGPLQGPALIILGAMLCAVGSPPGLQITSPRGMILTGAVLMLLSYASPLIYSAVQGNGASVGEAGTMLRTILWGAVGIPGLIMALVGIVRALFSGGIFPASR